MASMSLLHISDTHGLHRQLVGLPVADIIVHSGDITEHGTEEEAFDFINWLCDLPYRYKIFTAGNHDTCLYGAKLEGIDDNCHYLDGSSIIIEGIKFHGFPFFSKDKGNGRLHRFIQKIPSDTDVLISHCPPLGILDYADATSYGDFSLLEKVREVSPQLHLFGHIHTQNGVCNTPTTTYSNAALLSADSKRVLKQNVKRFQIEVKKRLKDK